MDLIITIKEVTGKCPVFKAGDTFRLKDGYKLVSDIPVCMHSLASLLPYYNALRHADPETLGISGIKNPRRAYLHCPNPECFTGGGAAVIEVERRLDESE